MPAEAAQVVPRSESRTCDVLLDGKESSTLQEYLAGLSRAYFYGETDAWIAAAESQAKGSGAILKAYRDSPILLNYIDASIDYQQSGDQTKLLEQGLAFTRFHAGTEVKLTRAGLTGQVASYLVQEVMQEVHRFKAEERGLESSPFKLPELMDGHFTAVSPLSRQNGYDFAQWYVSTVTPEYETARQVRSVREGAIPRDLQEVLVAQIQHPAKVKLLENKLAFSIPRTRAEIACTDGLQQEIAFPQAVPNPYDSASQDQNTGSPDLPGNGSSMGPAAIVGIVLASLLALIAGGAVLLPQLGIQLPF